MNCKDVEEIVIAEQDGQADALLRAALAEHLAGCESCRRAARAARAVFEQVAQLPVYAARTGFDAAVVAAATAVDREPPRPRARWLRLVYFVAGAAASLLFVVALGWSIGLAPDVQASTVLAEAVHHHQEAVADFTRSVALLPGAKPDMEIDLVRRDLEDSRLLPRNHELRSLVLVCNKQDRRPLLEVLDDSEQVLDQVSTIVRSPAPPTDALLRVRRVAMSFDAKPVAITWNARIEVKDLAADSSDGKAFVEFRRARKAFFRGDLVRALPGFQNFRVQTERNAELKPFEGVAVFSLNRCEEKLGLDSGSLHLEQDGAGNRMLTVRLTSEPREGVIVATPQVDRFFVILDQQGVKLDAEKRRIVEGALRTVIATKD
ncbi:MAG: zf-HC2 domain-containing protein [Planctomycetota bacterium]